MRLCCFIDPGTNLRCEQPSEWEAYAETGEPTEGCSAHIGWLLGDDIRHTLYPIKED